MYISIVHTELPGGFGDSGTKQRHEAPAREASRKLLRSRSLDWLKLHVRTFPAVKILKIFIYEAP